MKTTSYFHLATLGGLLVLAQTCFGQQGNYLGGEGAGANITTGSYNVFLGTDAGSANDEGSENTFVGNNAGSSNESGYANTFVGSNAGFTNTDGTDNTFIGHTAGNSNWSGSGNTFSGSWAGFYNTEGSDNTFIGTHSGYRNSTGNLNTALGYNAGTSYGVSTDGTFVTTSKNTTIGAYAGYFNGLSASNHLGENVFVGYKTGYTTKSGYYNTFLGSRAGYANSSGTGNVFLGQSAAASNTSGSSVVAIGREAGSKNTSGSSNVFVGTYANASAGTLTYANAIGHRAYVSSSNSLVLGSISGVNGASNHTKVGIGTTAPAYRLHLNASEAAKVGGGSWTVASDERLKRDVEAYKEGLEKVLAIKPVWFRYNGKAGITDDKRYVGVIAQEMQQIAPYTVGEFTYQDSTGKQEQYLDYDANALTYMLVNAVQEVDQKYAQQLAAKDAQIAQLVQELAQIKQMLSRLSPEVDKSVARLYQNHPNPFNQTTVIGYFIPENIISAQIKVYSVKGQEVYSQPLLQKGEGQVVISNETLAAGTYIYQLVVDGKRVDNKKFILTR